MQAMKSTSKAGWGGWCKLFLGVGAIWVFIFVVAPWVRTLPPVQGHLDFIRDSGIDATALFYTDSEEFGDAEITIRDVLEYHPSE